MPPRCRRDAAEIALPMAWHLRKERAVAEPGPERSASQVCKYAMIFATPAACTDAAAAAARAELEALEAS